MIDLIDCEIKIVGIRKLM